MNNGIYVLIYLDNICALDMMYDGNDYVILMDTQKSMVIYCLEIYKPKSKSPIPTVP